MKNIVDKDILERIDDNSQEQAQTQADILPYEEKIKLLPLNPGVYLMKDINNAIIYVGKAKNLKNRVSSYFKSFDSHSVKTQTLVTNIVDFDYIITDTESEALILENNMIKKYSPRFNIRLKDDKSYPFIKITKEEYPRVLKVREMRRDNAQYFGPYTSDFDVNQTLEVIHDAFQIRKSSRDLSRKYNRACLNYYIKRCSAPCMRFISAKDYGEMIDEIKLILDGKASDIIAELESKMLEASENLDFEKAIKYRNQVSALNNLKIKQKITSDSNAEQDIIALDTRDNRACIMVFFVRSGMLVGREDFMFENLSDDSSEELLNQFIPQFYGATAYIPREIIIEEQVADIELYENWLKSKASKSVNITVPKRGDKLKILEMLKLNVSDYLEKHFEREMAKNYKKIERLQLIQDFLKLDKLPMRIESYDISNILGTNSVASMVVYENGEKKPSDYRRFKIKTVVGADDYASMCEVITRRFSRLVDGTNNNTDSFERVPDLIIIDGGKNHVELVLNAMRSLKLDIKTIGLVKDDRHRTNSVYYNGEITPLDRHSRVYVAFSEIQEEVHRFAITYHKSLRDKEMIKSDLDNIKGIGEKKKIELLKHFKGIEGVKRASVEELMEVNKISKSNAVEIYNYWQITDDMRD